MAGWSNYRVKVDLSKYHQDARRFSWIYVNSSNIWFISHLKQHIVDVFGIQEPFHLLLNGNEYLPPAEDVRVLTENEIIAVEPGSGIFNGNVSTISMSTHELENDDAKDLNVHSVVDAITHRHKAKSVIQKVEETGDESIDVSMADATIYHSMLSVTEAESASDSKPKDDSITLSCSAIESNDAPSHKRKRIRRRKTSKPADSSLHNHVNEITHSNSNKPTILDSYTLPTGKHIRFDNAENDNKVCKVENGTSDTPMEEEKTRLNASTLPRVKSTSNASLATLLALRKCSSPLMFISKKIKHTNGNDSDQRTESEHRTESSNGTDVIRSVQNTSSNNIAQNNEAKISYLHLNPEEYPTLQSSTSVNDIIAFKILRIGKEYTPEVSGYIVAKTLGWCPKKMLYSFQILKGQDEIQAPLGKFSLPENETEKEENNTAQFNFAQLIEPRLINRK